MPSFRIEMRDGSPQSRPAVWPAAALRGNVRPGSWTAGSRDEAVLAEMRSVLDKMAAIQMVDVHLPTTDGRTVILSRYTEPEPDQALLLQQLKVSLPGQPPPRISSDDVPIAK
jgi:hypothetical protein